ncbi:glycosyltransferase family 2 protein [Patescibacteria group bacterium]|nr:glycosyltransferase family 2 protein [Patescibacteria group bacterium]
MVVDRHNKPMVAVVIVNFNGCDLLPDCLGSLAQQSFTDFTTILVDNNSQDESIKYARNNYPAVKIIPCSKNHGFAEGNNIGIRVAFNKYNPKYIVTLNNDTKVDPVWLQKLVEQAAQDDKIGACGSKILFHENPKLINSVGLIPFLDGQSEDRGIFQKDTGQFEQEEEVFGVNACATLYRADLLKKIGLFDADYFLYCEDTDLVWRIRLAGYRALYVPAAKVWHKQSITTGKFSTQTIYYVIRNGYWTALKNLPRTLWLKSLFFAPLRLLKIGMQSTRGDNFRTSYLDKQKKSVIIFTIIKAYLAAILGMPKMLPKRWKVLKYRQATTAEINGWLSKYSLPLRKL